MVSLRAAIVALAMSVAPVAVAGTPDVNGATSPTGQKHPGTILNEDLVEKRTYSERAADVPQQIAWVAVDGKWRAVTKIVVTGARGRLEITQYGADGTRLQTTYQAPRR